MGYTAGLYGNSMFNFLRNYQLIFHSNSPILHSHQQYMLVLISPPPLQQLLFSSFLIIAILVGVKRYLVFLIFISLMTK